MGLKAAVRRSLRRAKVVAVLTGKTLGVAATLAVVVVLWRALHEEERADLPA